MCAGKLAFSLKSKTSFALPVQRRANTSKVAVSQRRMTLSASPGLALAATRAPLLRPAAILQMAIKMHEVCWRGAQPLNWQKQNLRGRNKQVERATELIPRGARERFRRAGSASSAAFLRREEAHLVICVISSTYGAELRCFSCSLTLMSCAAPLLEDHFKEAKVQMAARQQTFQRSPDSWEL